MPQPLLLCSVYKTSRKSGMYLYVPNRDDFSSVPQVLMERFGQPQLVMHIPDKTDKKLHGVTRLKLQQAFDEQGFYLQMPPKQENWLSEYRAEMGLPPVKTKENHSDD